MYCRIDVDDSLAPIGLPADLLHELCKHALETQPEECCGLVLGDAERRFQQLVRCRNEMTALHQNDPVAHPRDGRAAFYMSAHDYLKALEDAEAAGLDVTAVYHSHVGVGAYLSEMDQEYAAQPLFPFPDADQIVIPVYDRTVRPVAIFRRGADGFVGHPVVRLDP
jgi:adenylyltransferase/sulfurtransferase